MLINIKRAAGELSLSDMMGEWFNYLMEFIIIIVFDVADEVTLIN